MNLKTLTTALIEYTRPPKPVADILASVEKNVAELLTAADRHVQRAFTADARADKLFHQADDHRLEANRAVRVAERFSALLS